MVTSAVEGEGKSTTVANLAVAIARGGREVILVDLDFRHPYLSDVLPGRGPAGADGRRARDGSRWARLSLPRRLVLTRRQRSLGERAGSNGKAAGRRRRFACSPPGTLPPNPGEFIGSEAVERVLADLRERADLVLIDSAPMLGIGDALTLASKVDALILVTRLNLLRRHDGQRARARARALPGEAARSGHHRRQRGGYVRVRATAYDRAERAAAGPASERLHGRRARSCGRECRQRAASAPGAPEPTVQAGRGRRRPASSRTQHSTAEAGSRGGRCSRPTCSASTSPSCSRPTYSDATPRTEATRSVRSARRSCSH